MAFVSRGHNTGGDTDTQQLRTYNSKDDLFDDEQKASDESGDEADFHDRPTYSHLTAAEQTLKWLLGQKHHLYFHGSRMWANHEDLHHVSDSLVSGGTLEHEVDAILLDLLLYDDFELAIKALSLLIQKLVCGVQLVVMLFYDLTVLWLTGIDGGNRSVICFDQFKCLAVQKNFVPTLSFEVGATRCFTDSNSCLLNTTLQATSLHLSTCSKSMKHGRQAPIKIRSKQEQGMWNTQYLFFASYCNRITRLITVLKPQVKLRMLSRKQGFTAKIDVAMFRKRWCIWDSRTS